MPPIMSVPMKPTKSTLPLDSGRKERKAVVSDAITMANKKASNFGLSNIKPVTS
jgi:hypothetical protein